MTFFSSVSSVDSVRSGMVTSDTLIIVNSTGKLAKISVKFSYTSQTIVGEVYKYAAKEFGIEEEDIKYYGLYLNLPKLGQDTIESILNEDQKLAEFKLSGEVVCEFKLKPWQLKVRLERGTEILMRFSPL